MPKIRRPQSLLAAVLLGAALTTPAPADPGDPVAVRLWPAGGVTVETLWDLHLGLRITDTHDDALPRPVDAVLTREQTGLVLDRRPNHDHPTTSPRQADDTDSPNAVTATWAAPRVALIQVDGVRIADASRADPDAPLGAADLLHGVDVLLTPAHADAAQLAALARALAPRIAVLAPDTPVTRVDDASVAAIPHNTVAVSAPERRAAGTRWLKTTTQPWVMDDELAAALSRKEALSAASQAVFAPLSAHQMDFVPGNGTHTPRWNPEHMVSTERLFVSRIYHSVDPEIPVLNQRPRQQPGRYTPAQPTWTGAEEARHMQRTGAFTRRFIHLLEAEATVPDTPANIRSNRLFRTPRGILPLMGRHYTEHTEHVKTKMALPHWPAE